LGFKKGRTSSEENYQKQKHFLFVDIHKNVGFQEKQQFGGEARNEEVMKGTPANIKEGVFSKRKGLHSPRTIEKDSEVPQNSKRD